MNATILSYNPPSGEFKPLSCNYAGNISDKAWRGINAQFLAKNNTGKFHPLDSADAYQIAVIAAENAAAKLVTGTKLKNNIAPDTYVIGAAKLAMANYFHRQVRPTRQERASFEDGRIAELRVTAPQHLRAKRAFERICELLFRIRHTNRAMWEEIVTVCAAMIVADGNQLEAAKLIGCSKSTWYRKWPIWRKWLRAASRNA